MYSLILIYYFFSLQELRSLLEKDTGVPGEHQELFIHDGSDLTSFISVNTVRFFNRFEIISMKRETKKYDLRNVARIRLLYSWC